MPKASYQEWLTPEKILRTGERIVDDFDRGETGWLDWDNDYEARDGVHTARLKSTSATFDIQVNDGHQGQGVGEALLEYVAVRTQQLGYQELLILGSTNKAKGFYEKVLSNLKTSDAIKGFSVAPRKIDQNTTDWNFRIKLS